MKNEDDLDRELRLHVEIEAEEQRLAGLDADAADRAARRTLGSTARIKEDVRALSRWAPIESLARDVQFGLRMLRKHPAFTAAVTLTLALGVGASSALFTLVHNVLLRPLSIPEADRVVLVYNSYPKAGIVHVGAAGSDYIDRLAGTTAFEEQSLFATFNPGIDVNGLPERVHAMRVTASFFRLVRVPPRAGRTFSVEEESAGRDRVAILTSGLADRLFGSGDAIGREIRLNGEPHVVVGVMPREFAFVDAGVELWLPLTLTDRDKQHSHANNWTYVARLKPGATIERAQSEIDAVNAANLEHFPDTRQVVLETGFRSVAVRLQDDLVHDIRPTLQYLWGGALFVLLIGVLNVASLVQARTHARTREFATRVALGAGAPRIVRQLVVEHVVLALGAALLGLVVAAAALRLVGGLDLEHLPAAATFRIDGAVVAYTIATALALGTLLGAMTAAGALPTNPLVSLRLESRAATSSRGGAMRRALVVLQVSVAFVLLTGAGLMIASFRRAATSDLGFATERVLTASVNLPAARYGDLSSLRVFADDTLTAIRALPGVSAAGATSSIPLGDDYGMRLILAEGYRPPQGESFVGSYSSAASPGFFEAMGATLVSGRFVDGRDADDEPRTIVVDTRLARRFWPGQDPIGRRMYFPNARDPFALTSTTPTFVVVGVVKELMLRGAVNDIGSIGAFYLPLAQSPARTLTFAVSTAGDPVSLAESVRSAIRRRDPQLPIYDMRSMADRARAALVVRRLPAIVGFSFGFVALCLSAIGLYGALAYVIGQRTKEIGIRIALGGSRRDVFGLIAREGAALVTTGLAIGVVAAWIVDRQVQSYLFGVSADDPAIVWIAALVLGSAGAIACVLPARRATRIDPVAALAE